MGLQFYVAKNDVAGQGDQEEQQGRETHTVGRLATVVGAVIVRTGSACGASGGSERGETVVVGGRRWAGGSGDGHV